MLACIIPGYLLLLLANLLFAPNITLEIDNVSKAIGVFTLSYLTGLLLKWLMKIYLMVSYATDQIEFAAHTTNQIVYSRKKICLTKKRI